MREETVIFMPSTEQFAQLRKVDFSVRPTDIDIKVYKTCKQHHKHPRNAMHAFVTLHHNELYRFERDIILFPGLTWYFPLKITKC